MIQESHVHWKDNIQKRIFFIIIALVTTYIISLIILRGMLQELTSTARKSMSSTMYSWTSTLKTRLMRVRKLF